MKNLFCVWITKMWIKYIFDTHTYVCEQYACLHVCTEINVRFFTIAPYSLREIGSHLESTAILARMAGQMANESRSCLSLPVRGGRSAWLCWAVYESAAGLNSGPHAVWQAFYLPSHCPPFFGKQSSKTNTKLLLLMGLKKDINC